MKIADFTARLAQTHLAALANSAPWSLTQKLEDCVRVCVANLGTDYAVSGIVAVHNTARVEAGADLKGAIIIGPNAFVSGSALLRGGVFLDEGCILGPCVEAKTVVLLKGSKLAHLNFVGDSILGADVNVEAGAMIANYRNERADKRIRFRIGDNIIDTGVEKFGAITGDGSRIGANAVIAPGAALEPATIVPRLGLVDQGLPDL